MNFPSIVQDKINFYLWNNNQIKVIQELKQTHFIYGSDPLNTTQVLLDMFHQSWNRPDRKYRLLKEPMREELRITNEIMEIDFDTF